tara:strand:+ start:8310 stop:8939 length:630 start_codon:yes stop_codon:yes gene_type:complete
MKVKINIPNKLEEITLKQYQKWLKIAEGKEDENFIKQKMIEIFCNIPLKQVLQIKLSDVDIICQTINEVFEKKPVFKNKFVFNEIEFGFIPKLDDITLGEHIDLETYLNDFEYMHKAMSVLYRPITYKNKDQYLIEDYEGSNKYNLENISLDIALGASVFFWNLKKELLTNILNYLQTQTEVEIPQNLLDFLKNGDGINQFTGYVKETY